MRGFKAINLFFILLFPMTLIGADNRLTVYGGNAQSQDVAALQKIVLRMVMGLQKQEPYLVYKHFQPGPNSGLKNPGTELESLKGTLNALCRAFDHRSRINKPSDDVSNTFDFIDLKKDVHLAQDGNSAWVDLELGFYSLPGNPEVLRNLPSEVVGAMTESEKEMKSRFIVTRLDFHKSEGAWYLSSLENLDRTLHSFLQHYTEVEAAPASKTKK